MRYGNSSDLLQIEPDIAACAPNHIYHWELDAWIRSPPFDNGGELKMLHTVRRNYVLSVNLRTAGRLTTAVRRSQCLSATIEQLIAWHQTLRQQDWYLLKCTLFNTKTSLVKSMPSSWRSVLGQNSGLPKPEVDFASDCNLHINLLPSSDENFIAPHNQAIHVRLRDSYPKFLPLTGDASWTTLNLVETTPNLQWDFGALKLWLSLPNLVGLARPCPNFLTSKRS